MAVKMAIMNNNMANHMAKRVSTATTNTPYNKYKYSRIPNLFNTILNRNRGSVTTSCP